MEKLLNALEKLYSNPDDIYESKGDNGGPWFGFTDSELLHEVKGLCCDHLIAAGGGCNWGNIRILNQHGYRVFAGEEDSWGWLTGCVKKRDDKRTIVYG